MRALITGGSGAIGKALVREFSSDYEVIFTYLNNIEAGGIRCDITDRAAVFKLINEYPHFDLLINNAGISDIKLFTDITIDEWNRMLAVNLTGAFNVTQAVLPAMIRRKSGVIVNVSSIWGEIGASCEVHYSAAKAGLIGFSKALAKEVEPSGVRVCYIAPGAVESPMNNGFTKKELLAACPDGKVLMPEEVAKEVRQIITCQRSSRI
ncbi:MAG: SDR family NAD(P)-dependent oxidoreductase [Oscillospiraceae bacterium]|jgi:3-oxoacyl-[acyl-carrier protein] reductase|nr:SDR family NAD(P)-dependent oxidoreductase [Oscillospiraceae bacterium]